MTTRAGDLLDGDFAWEVTLMEALEPALTDSRQGVSKLGSS